jgi:hypothetical protein
MQSNERAMLDRPVVQNMVYRDAPFEGHFLAHVAEPPASQTERDEGDATQPNEETALTAARATR